MTDTEINTAIAEVMGLSWPHVDELKRKDFANSLDAMADAEQVLRDRCKYWPDYIDELVRICTYAYPHLPGERLAPNWSATVGATAPQRATAFLKTLGKWKNP